MRFDTSFSGRFRERLVITLSLIGIINSKVAYRTEFQAERNAMMQRWADYLDKLKSGADVIDSRKRSVEDVSVVRLAPKLRDRRTACYFASYQNSIDASRWKVVPHATIQHPHCDFLLARPILTPSPLGASLYAVDIVSMALEIPYGVVGICKMHA